MTAQKTTVTEPETPDTGATATVTEPARTPSVDMVFVRDTNTGAKLDRPVPVSWLTRFPNLKQVPSDKARTTTPTKKGGK